MNSDRLKELESEKERMGEEIRKYRVEDRKRKAELAAMSDYYFDLGWEIWKCAASSTSTK